MSNPSQNRYRSTLRQHENQQTGQRGSRSVRQAWGNPPSPQGTTDDDANSSFDRSQQRQRHRPSATDEGDMETEETRDKSNEDLKTTIELINVLDNLPALVGQSKKEITTLAKVARENAELKKKLEQVTTENQLPKSTSSTNQLDQNNKLKEDLENARVESEKYKNAFLDIKGRLIQKIESTKTMNEAALKDIDKIEELEKNLQQHKQGMDELARENESLKKELSRSKDNYKKAEGDKRTAESELSQSRTRLSRLMGNKLSDNNPDIADLSDKNRPTKIAEKYTELYDNEWTDAFEVLDKDFHDEQRTVEALLKMLWDVKDQCDKITKDQYEKLREAVELKRTRDNRLPEHILKQIKDLRRLTVEASRPEVIEKCLENTRYKRYSTWMKNEHVETFYKSCVELCWLMSVQDPPLLFGEIPKKMATFDTEMYKPYTATGSNVDYVVWPTLLLNESGPLLSKGVAQPCGQQPNKSFKQKNTEYPPISDTKIPTSTWHIQRAPAGQVMDRQRLESVSDGKRQNHHFSNGSSNVHGTGQIDTHNYEQSVIGGGNHAEKYKNLSQTTRERMSAASANKNENPIGSQREPSDRKVIKPRDELMRKFYHLLAKYGIDSYIIKTELGEDYMACRNYYESFCSNRGESSV